MVILIKVVWKFAMMVCGGLFAVITGLSQMLRWLASSWDIQLQVLITSKGCSLFFCAPKPSINVFIISMII